LQLLLFFGSLSLGGIVTLANTSSSNSGFTGLPEVLHVISYSEPCKIWRGDVERALVLALDELLKVRRLTHT